MLLGFDEPREEGNPCAKRFVYGLKKIGSLGLLITPVMQAKLQFRE